MADHTGPSESAPNRLRVLIVEDSEDDAKLLVRELRRGGYEPFCERVDTAAAMRTALGRQGWDLVVSDHSLPQFDSFSALKMLTDSETDAPFIIVSGTLYPWIVSVEVEWASVHALRVALGFTALSANLA